MALAHTTSEAKQRSLPPLATPEGMYGKPALLAMLGIALVILLAALDQTIVSTALPRIIAELHGFELYAWVATAYLLTSTIVIPVVGKAGDLYGRKPLLLAAIVIFVGASALAGSAPTMLMLIIARAIQGIGAGMLMSTAFTSVGDMFPQPERRARWQGIITSAFGLASVVGPALGGIMTEALGWRSVFYVNLPIGLLAIVVLWYTLPAHLSPRAPHARIDWAGAVTIMLGVSALLLAVEWSSSGAAWLSPRMLGLLGFSLLQFMLFGWIERHTAEPLLPLHLFALRPIALCSLLSLTTGFALFGLVFYTPLFLQGVLGLSPSSAGLYQTPLVVSMAIGSLISGQVFARSSQSQPLMIIGASLFLDGVLLLSQATTAIPPVILSIELALCGLGIGMLLPMLTVIVQAVVPRHQLGVGTSSMQFLRLIGSTLGTAVVGALVSSMFVTQITATLPRATDPALTATLSNPQVLVHPELQAQLQTQIQAQQPGIDAAAWLQHILSISQDALAASIQVGYLLASGIGLCIFVLVLLLGEPIQAWRAAHRTPSDSTLDETPLPVH